jgi:hypothetical protein
MAASAASPAAQACIPGVTSSAPATRHDMQRKNFDSLFIPIPSLSE